MNAGFLRVMVLLFVGGLFLQGVTSCQDRSEGQRKFFEKTLSKAEKGDVEAQTLIGGFYLNGVGVEKDCSEAMKWYRKAADQGDVRAQLNLAKMYRNGEGVKTDYAEALKLLKKPLDMEYSEARLCLGLMYYNGEGVEKNNAEAYVWWDVAASRGNEQAAKKLTEIEGKMSTQQIADAQKRSAKLKREIQETVGYK